jgi:hypothetical protein
VEAPEHHADKDLPCCRGGRQHDVGGYQQRHLPTFPQLEDQMTNFASDIDRAAAGYSPDRVDALVWAFSELLVEPMKSEGIFELYRRNAEAAEQRDKPQPTQTTSAIGSTEWLAEQKKSQAGAAGRANRAHG